MTETPKTFVGARLAVNNDRKKTPDVAAEDDALVSLLADAASDLIGHFAQEVRHFESTYFRHTPSILSQLVCKEKPLMPHLNHHLLMESC